MGNSDTKLNFRKAVVELTTKTQPVEAGDEAFWSQFWSDSVTCVQDVFTLIPAAEIRALREESPSNLATLCYKAVEKMVAAAESGCGTMREQQTVLNCVRLLTRILPYIFEDPDWRGFFWSTLPGQSIEDQEENESPPLAQSLINGLSDLLFCPDFTVAPNKKSGPDTHEDMTSIDSCEYIWEAGVGFAHSPPTMPQYDSNRCEILKLLMTCFSETMYLPPVADAHSQPNQWIHYFTSTENRHALPLFTSMLNIVCAYDPIGYGVPYNHLMFSDSREPLVEAALQVLCVTMDNSPANAQQLEQRGSTSGMDEHGDVGGSDNLFVNYLSRIHREEDFYFILKGLTRLLNNPLVQTYLPGSCKKVQFHQELFVMFWKMCDINKKFMFYVLKSSDVLDILVPILYHLNDARADQSRVGLMHIGVFILLLLSGERNFGVRLNKPYSVRVPMDIPVFTGTHADFLIIVFHKIITTGHQRLQPLFDCLLTIIVNVSPYLKTLSMVASTKMLHLLEAFSTPWFLYASPTNHHLVFFLLEVFNNIIQYQFDGNANLVYTIIRKRNVFHQLANLPADHSSIARALTKRGRKVIAPITDHPDQPSMEGSMPAAEAEPGTLKATLAATPALPCRLVTLSREEAMFGGQDAFDPEYELMYHMNRDMKDPWESVLELAFKEQAKQHHSRHPKLKDISRTKSLRIPAVKKRRRKLSLPQTEFEWDDKFLQCAKPPPPEPPKLTMLELAALKSEDTTALKSNLARSLGIEKMTEKSPASAVHIEQHMEPLATPAGAASVQPGQEAPHPSTLPEGQAQGATPVQVQSSSIPTITPMTLQAAPVVPPPSGAEAGDDKPKLSKAKSLPTPPGSPTGSLPPGSEGGARPPFRRAGSTASSVAPGGAWVPTPEWVGSWKQKLPLQTIMRLLQVLVPQVEKICIDKGLTDESEILKFLQHGTLVGLLPVPHPILIRKYQANSGTTMWFRTYMWGVIYLRNVDPPIWYDTDVKLFEIQRV